MEILGLVIAILSLVLVIILFVLAANKSDIRVLHERIKELKSANKIIYKDLVEEYRLLIKADKTVKHHEHAVEFNPYFSKPLKEYVLYTELENKIAEVKELKARLCDNQCTNSPLDIVSIGDGSSFLSPDPLGSIEIVQPKKAKKPRKKK